LNIINNILDRAYKNAKKVKINKNSKIIFFSDLHKGDNSYADDFAHNIKIYDVALQDYFKNDFTYIELGDGIELWENKSFEPIYKAYESTFKLLDEFHQKNRLHLLWGNHDMEFRNPMLVEKMMRFVFTPKNILIKQAYFNLEYSESLLLEIENSNKNILAIHGHQADYMNYVHWKFNRFFVRYLWKYLQKWFGVNDPTSPAKNYKNLIKVEKRINQWIINNQHQMVICGHTHRPRFPDPEDIPLFNDGSCVHPQSIIGIEIVDLKISLIKWVDHFDERTQEKQIIKVILEGPTGLHKFL